MVFGGAVAVLIFPELFFPLQKLMCECPWVVKDPETKEMVLERTTLATLVLLVKIPPT